jgi:predicted ribosome quality control (RQC) complex YloA/Tae2 family protein
VIFKEIRIKMKRKKKKKKKLILRCGCRGAITLGKGKREWRGERECGNGD